MDGTLLDGGKRRECMRLNPTRASFSSVGEIVFVHDPTAFWARTRDCSVGLR